jgi:hypothetical protein
VACVPLAHQLLDEARSRHGLQLTLVLKAQLPGGVVVGEQQRPDGVRREDLRDRDAADEFARVYARGGAQGYLLHLSRGPSARDRARVPRHPR